MNSRKDNQKDTLSGSANSGSTQKSSSEQPPRITEAVEKLIKLQQLGVYLLPVRHHSPACAFATLQALEQLHPADILIEAPTSFNELLTDLQHQDCKPPLAVLCQTKLSGELPEETISVIDDSNETTYEDDASEAPPSKEFDKLLRSAYFPFCDYSPEWVALRFPLRQVHRKKTAHVECIDLPWCKQVAHQAQIIAGQDWQSQSLQQERYLAHSAYVKALAEKLHCRNHDEVWEHLFELDGTEFLQDWQAFFHKVLVWCCMSRIDYEEDVLAAEGSLVREQHMLEKIIARYHQAKSTKQKKPSANIVVITGGFHTLPLIEGLYDALIDKKAKNSKKSTNNPTKEIKHIKETGKTISNITTTADESWLIRYSFDRLDALNGYNSGMPSPAFYQTCWQEMLTYNQTLSSTATATKNDENNSNNATNSQGTRQRLIIDFLSEFSRELRSEQILPSSFVSVKNASEQAIRLAELREHKLIGRFDLMDACHSSFIKGSRDDGYLKFHQQLHTKLSGSHLGHVVHTTRTPPILAQVAELVKQQRFNVTDTISRSTKLDVLRKPNHRKRSCLLHLLNFLQVDFAKRQSGPDFLHGGQLHLLFEEWLYAWTPQVEAALIELSEHSSDIYQLAINKLLQQKQHFINEGQGQSSAQVICLLIQASLMGLPEQTNTLFDEVSSMLPDDPELESVLKCAQHVLYLWTGRQFLQLDNDQQLIQLMRKIPITALFLLSQQQTPSDEQIDDSVTQLIELRTVLKQLQPILTTGDNSADGNKNPHACNNSIGLIDDFHQTLQRLLVDWQAIDKLLGAVHALQFIDERIDEPQLAQHLQTHFATGAEAEQAVAYLAGMMQAVPTLFLHHKGMVAMLNDLVSTWDNDTFVALLPDLRLAFTSLKPMQTDEIAQQVASIYQVSSTEVSHHQSQLSEADVMQGVAINQQLAQILEKRGLSEWI